jgi:hypothetical protein
MFRHFLQPKQEAVDEWATSIREGQSQSAEPYMIDHVVSDFSVNKRRFAGDYTLSASRYSTVAHNSKGNDNGTLLAELSAYYDDRLGQCAISETYDKAGSPDAHEGSLGLLIELIGTPGSNAAIARLGTSRIWIPFRVDRERIPNVLDLRYAPSQLWFHKEFAAIYRHWRDWHGSFSDAVTAAEIHGPVYPKPKSFFDMLPVLMDPKHGGNKVTDYIGRVLRINEISALVYPSARTNVGVAWTEEGTMNSSGWNLIDYRGLRRPAFGPLVILGGDPWDSPYAKHFEIRKAERNSWAVFPPKTKLSKRDPVPDDDLAVRYQAGKTLFSQLIPEAARVMAEQDLTWLEALLKVSDTDGGLRIRAYMGISSVHAHRDELGQLRAALFECWSRLADGSRASKGYAVLPGPPHQTSDSLDAESSDYQEGQLALKELPDGMYLYYLRQASI